MADTITRETEGIIDTPQGEGTAQTGAAAQSGSARTEPRTFTQEEVNAIVEKRVARVKATPPADYEDLKAKAARLDELEQANKSELERANDAATAATTRAEELQRQLDALQAESERARQVRDMASQYGVDADMLSRMGGDVEDNAQYLKARMDAMPKFGDMHDGGEHPSSEKTLEEIEAIADPLQRVRERAAYFSTHPNKR